MADRRDNVFNKYPRTFTALFMLGIFFLADIVIANIYKLYTGQTFETTYRIRSEIYSHDLKKNVCVKNAVWGDREYVICTDSQGFKSNAPKETQLTRTTHRMLFIGDSFTEGIGMSYADTFVGIIASELAKKNIDVLNAAVTSYSPVIYWRKIKYLIEDIGLQFNEVIVFLDISDVQDEATRYHLLPDNTVASKGATFKTRIREHTIVTYVTLRVLNTIFQNVVGGQGSKDNSISEFGDINMERAMWTTNHTLFNDYGRYGLEMARTHMDMLWHLLKENNIRLTIAVYPWPHQILTNDLHSIQVGFWRDWAKSRNDVAFLNYFPCFMKQDDADMQHHAIISKYFIKGDVHWNESGHRLIARGFLSYFGGRERSFTDHSAARDLTSTTLHCGE